MHPLLAKRGPSLVYVKYRSAELNGLPLFFFSSCFFCLSLFMFDRIIQRHPDAVFVLRFYAQQHDLADAIVLLDLGGADPTVLGNATNGMGMEMNALTERWVGTATSRLLTMLE